VEIERKISAVVPEGNEGRALQIENTGRAPTVGSRFASEEYKRFLAFGSE
jgi:hypothetical protein